MFVGLWVKPAVDIVLSFLLCKSESFLVALSSSSNTSFCWTILELKVLRRDLVLMRARTWRKKHWSITTFSTFNECHWLAVMYRELLIVLSPSVLTWQPGIVICVAFSRIVWHLLLATMMVCVSRWNLSIFFRALISFGVVFVRWSYSLTGGMKEFQTILLPVSWIR